MARMMSAAIVLSAMSLSALPGCETSGVATGDELAAADHGDPIAPDRAHELALAVINDTLKTDASKIQWGPLVREGVRERYDSGAMIFGFRMDAKVPPVSSDGKEQPIRPFVFLFKNGEIAAAFTVDPNPAALGGSPKMQRIR